MSAAARMNRLTADDDLFWKVHRLFGSVLLNQMGWWFDEPLDRDTLTALHRHLAHGFLARRIVCSRVPFARPWWEPSTVTVPLAWQEEPVAENRVVEWLSQQGEVDLDPSDGSLWRLSAAPVGRGMVVSLVASHVGADGSAGLVALSDALDRLAQGLEPSRADSSGRLVGDRPESGLWRADLADAAGQVGAIGRGIAGAYRAREVSEPGRVPRDLPPHYPSDQYTPAQVIVNVPLSQWNPAARKYGGTANGLMIGTAVGILGRSGRLGDRASVRVDIPRMMRTPDDPRGNATTGIPISVPYIEGESADLALIRAITKQAMTAYDDPASTPPLQHLQPLQMVIPDILARRFVRTSKAPICLCTNLGSATESVATIGGVRARRVVMRPIIRPRPTEFFRRTEIGLSMSWSSDDEQVTLAVIGADPDAFPSTETLRGHVRAEFDAWGLAPAFW